MHKSLFLITVLFFAFCPYQDGKASNISIKNVNAPDMFNLYSYPRATPTASFLDENEQEVSLKNFRGKIILMNIWSTTCTQCIVELPMLDRLQKDMGGLKFQVIALSTGMEPVAALKKFYLGKNVKNLKVYADTQAFYSQAADVKGLPTTFLINEDGQEIGRIRGIVEWDGVKIKAQIRDLIRTAKEKEKERREALQSEEIPLVEKKEADPADSIPPPPRRPEEEIQRWFKR